MAADYTTITNLRGPAARITSFTAKTVPADQPADARMTGPDQNRQIEVDIPRGLPGVNAVENDEAVATYLGAEDSETHGAFRVASVGTRGTVIDTDHANLEAALAATPLGGVLEIRNAHVRSSAFTVDKAVTVRFVNAGRITQTVASGHGMVITASGVTIESPRLFGTGGLASSTATGLRAEGVSGLNIIDPYIDGWSQYGIMLSLVTDFKVTGGIVKNIAYAAVMLLSCARGEFNTVEVDTVIQPGALTQSYGFAATRLSTQSIATHPLTTDIRFLSCIARNVSKWEAFDTHGGRRIEWINCQAINSYHGFAAVGCPDKFSVPEGPGWAPRDILIQGCIADSTVTDGSRGAGLQFSGVGVTTGTAHEYATGIIQGMTIKGHGDAANGNQGGTYILTTRGLQIKGITLVDCSPHGLLLAHTNHDFDISGVVVVDPWKATAGGDAPAAVAFRSTHNVGNLSNVRVYRGAKAATQVLGYGVRNWQNTVDTTIAYTQVEVEGASVGKILNPGNRMGWRIDGAVGFFGAQPTTKPTVAGSRGGNAALTSLLNALSGLGLITDSSIT